MSVGRVENFSKNLSEVAELGVSVGANYSTRSMSKVEFISDFSYSSPSSSDAIMTHSL